MIDLSIRAPAKPVSPGVAGVQEKIDKTHCHQERPAKTNRDGTDCDSADGDEKAKRAKRKLEDIHGTALGLVSIIVRHDCLSRARMTASSGPGGEADSASRQSRPAKGCFDLLEKAGGRSGGFV